MRYTNKGAEKFRYHIFTCGPPGDEKNRLPNIMTDSEVQDKIRAAAVNGKIPCESAFQLAQDLGISRSRLGELLNELKIKIIQCQLGCF